jgi:Rad3-related DNA helicase
MTLDTSLGALYHEAERLDNRSLDAFIAQILSMQVRRQMSDVQAKEAELLKKINQSLPIDKIERFRFLNEKRQETVISTSEQAELIDLLEKIEKSNVNRLKYLTTLSRLRGVSVRDLMQQLGIHTSING